jgi:hypothetical protein
LIRDPFNGSGLVDALTVGAIDITGSFTTPVGQDLLLETKMADVGQTGVDFSYNYKAGSMVLTGEGMTLTSDATAFEGAPTSTRKHTYSFKCTAASLGTS